jgi:hypothetical protein
MTEVQTDATKALAETKATISKLDAEEAKIKAWYESHLFWAGAIAGAIIALVVRHFV